MNAVKPGFLYGFKPLRETEGAAKQDANSQPDRNLWK